MSAAKIPRRTDAALVSLLESLHELPCVDRSIGDVVAQRLRFSHVERALKPSHLRGKTRYK